MRGRLQPRVDFVVLGNRCAPGPARRETPPHRPSLPLGGHACKAHCELTPSSHRVLYAPGCDPIETPLIPPGIMCLHSGVGKTTLLFTTCLNWTPDEQLTELEYTPTTVESFGTTLFITRPLAAFITEIGLGPSNPLHAARPGRTARVSDRMAQA